MKIDGTHRPLPSMPPASENSERAASRAGTQDLVEQVDFPPFVAALISGVFDAVVDQSIQQMEAYGDLVKGTSKSVDEFRRASDTTDDDDG